MNLIEIADREQWDAFQASQPYAQFLQSWAWGEFAAAQGRPVKRYALAENGGAWLAAIQMEFRERRFGLGYWFAPRGPVLESRKSKVESRREVMRELTEKLLARPELRRRALFWRMEPVSELSEPEALLPLAFRRTSALDPVTTVILDLGPGEDDLLSRMHEKTRYNIRLAERHGVSVRTGSSERDLGEFLRLMAETAARDRFVQHAPEYLKVTFTFLRDNGIAQLRVAEFEGKTVAANLEVLFGDTVTYLYGASSNEHRNVMAPYALQWDAIREAKRRGYRTYDFWGANPQSKAMYDYKPSWEGITRFKMGFGARLVNLAGTWDLPFNIYLYRLLFLKRFFRG